MPDQNATNASLLDHPIGVRLFPSDAESTFRTIEALLAFATSERDYWQPLKQGILHEVHAHFANAVLQITQAIRTADSGAGEQMLRKAVSHLNKGGYPAIFSSTQEGRLLKQLYDTSPAVAEGYCSYRFKRDVPAPSGLYSPSFMKGMLTGYFLHDAPTDTQSLVVARNEAMQESIEAYTTGLDSLRQKHEELLSQSRSNYDEILSQTEQWRQGIVKTTEDWVEATSHRMKQLEGLYAEKLRLEGPATYWSTLSTEYESRGRRWRWWAIGTAASLVAAFGAFLFLPPGTLSATALSPDSIRTILILAFIASVGVYIVRLFVKLSTSDFHLSRDATERLHLTHLYLALANDKQVTDAERAIVLQSLFSRADTGLLKGDSSPAFPEGLATQILKNLRP